MFLRRLLLNGFKAFGEKTSLELLPGIGVLVGPNGCGKSNVIDAIKWVFGEQRISELRGELMEDLIFHGGGEKESYNAAEVELIIDNRSRRLKLDFEEVSLLRRLYRSGESEYFINRTPCRLKDIQALLFQAEVGQLSSCFIAQGKVEAVLSEKLKERRKVFEEAALISKYRERRREYERKMTQTKENLSRVATILRELERRQARLKQQSEESELYFKFHEALKKVQLQLLALAYLEEEQAKKIAEEKLAFQAAEFEALQRTVEEINALTSRSKLELEEKRGWLRELEKEQIKHSEKTLYKKERLKTVSAQISECRRSTSSQQGALSQLEKELETTVVLVRRLEEELTAVEKQEQAEVSQQAQQKKKLNSLMAEQEMLRQAAQQQQLQQNDLLQKQATGKKKQEKLVKQLLEDLKALKRGLEKKPQLAQQEPLSLELLTKKHTLFLAQASRLVAAEQLPSKSSRAVFKVALEEYERLFAAFLSQAGPLYGLIFSAEGVYAAKEKLDTVLQELEQKKALLEKQQAALTKKQERVEEEQGIEKNRLQLLGLKLIGIAEKQAKLASELKERRRQLQSLRVIFTQSETELNTLKKTEERLEQEKKMLLKEFSVLKISEGSASKELAKRTEQLKQVENEVVRLEGELQSKQKKLLQTQEKRNETRLLKELAASKLNELSQAAKKQFSSVLFPYLEPLRKERLRAERKKKLASELTTLKAQLKRVGRVNPLAKEDYSEVKSEVEKIVTQREDLLAAMQSLEAVTRALDNEAQEKFTTTFKRVQENFDRLFKRLFLGGKAILALQDETRPLESEIQITAAPPGKRAQKLSLFSGGEKTLIALSLLFAIFLEKPAPFCLLDEVDAALDGENLERLANLFKEVQQKTQLLLISHNQQTMQIVDYMYGITMRDGVSRLFSIKTSQASD